MFKKITSFFTLLTFLAAPVLTMARELTPVEEALFMQILLEQIAQAQAQKGSGYNPPMDNLYVELVTNSLDRDSFTTEGSMGFDFELSEFGDLVMIDMDFDFKVAVDMVQEEFDFEFAGEYDINIPEEDFEEEGEFDLRARYMDDYLYFYIDGLPREVLPRSVQNKWIEVDVEKIAREEGFEVEEIWESFGEFYELAQDEYLDELPQYDFVIVEEEGDAVNNFTGHAGEEVTIHNVEFNIDKLVDFSIRETQEQYAQWGFEYEFTAEERREMGEIMEPLLDNLDINVYVLDGTEIVGSQIQFEMYTDGEEFYPTENKLSKRDDYVVLDITYEDVVYDIDQGVHASVPGNTMDIIDFFEELDDANEGFYADYKDAEEQAMNAHKISNVKQMALAMELLRDQNTGDFPAFKRLRDMDDLGGFLDVEIATGGFDSDYGWEDNRYDTDKFCVWVELEDGYEDYFAASHQGAGYTNDEPDIDDCI